MNKDLLALEFADMIAPRINELAEYIHHLNEKWWVDLATGKPIERNAGEMLMLIVSEIAECMEGVRKNTRDSHLPHRSAEEVELADAVIRILDYAAGRKLNLGDCIAEKLLYNYTRTDHTLEHRRGEHGKKF